MRVRDVMTTNVVTVGPEMEVGQIARLLVEKHISGVPVVDESGRCIGIVSEGDLVRRIGEEEDEDAPRTSWWLELLASPEERARHYVRTHGRKAKDVMTPDPVTVRPEDSIGKVARILEEHRIKRAPVVDDQGRVVGIVSRADLLRALATAAREAPPPAVDDRTLRARVFEAFDRANLTYHPYVNVVVREGVVHIWGFVSSREEAEALRVAAENVEGVRGVEVHLAVKPAMAGL